MAIIRDGTCRVYNWKGIVLWDINLSDWLSAEIVWQELGRAYGGLTRASEGI
jgi:hypothetical protein